MIRPDATFVVTRIPLSQITVWECQERYPERALHYVRLMREHPAMDCGFISVEPSADGRYLLLDGHHRFVAAILTGRRDLLAVVIREP